jgi:hypothetical protein
MAQVTPQLLSALYLTADRLASGATYQWTHQGHCNCGHLVQTLTDLTPAQIHAQALLAPGDWAEKARDYCPGTGIRLDFLIDTLLSAGLNTDDIAHLERLSDPRVLSLIPGSRNGLNYRDRSDVVRYLRAWALQLSTQLAAQPVLAYAV